MDYGTKIKANIPKKYVTFLVTFVFFWAAHGKRFSNLTLNGDSLSVVENQFEWQVGLGRFVQPILWALRGVLTAPWLYGVISFILTAGAVYLIVDLLEIKSNVAMIGIAGVMVCNKTYTYAIAAYIEWMDIYAFALFFSVLGVWLMRKKPRYIPLAALAIALGMGLYQAYVSVSIGLIMILMFMDLCEEIEIRAWFQKYIKDCGVLAIGAVLYFIIWKIVLFISGVAALDTGNSSGAIGGYTMDTIIFSIYRTYKNFLIYLRRPPVYIIGYETVENFIQVAVAAINVLMIGAIVYLIIKRNFQNNRIMKYCCNWEYLQYFRWG